MFKYTGKDGKNFKILDTDDGLEESISGLECYNLILDGITIVNMSLTENDDIIDESGDVIWVSPKQKKNVQLSKAKALKNDEFFTLLSDIETELSKYPKDIFKDKIIYCPADVATEHGSILKSEFVHYFQLHAHELQFKELIATCLHDKSTGVGYADGDERSNNYHLVRHENIYEKEKVVYPVAEIMDDFGQMRYMFNDGHTENIPNSVINEAVTGVRGGASYISMMGIFPKIACLM